MILNDSEATDLFHLLCGEEIGRGQYRVVYQHALDRRLVVKHDTRANWSNVQEYAMWCNLQDGALSKWLAPVEWLSPGGIWLIQAKTRPIPIGKYPKKVPAIFADIKPENWGLYKGRPVCHDYGNHAAFVLAEKAGAALETVVWEHRQ